MEDDRTRVATRIGLAGRSVGVTMAVAVGLALGGGMLVATLFLGLNGDIQYNLGGLSVHEADDPAGWVRTFTHRPAAYRAIMAVILDGSALLGLTPGTGAFEVTVRLGGVAFAMLSGLAVGVAVRRRIPTAEAAAAGIAVAASLALAPNFDFLQAEWFAAGLTAAAIGIAVGARRAWVGAGAAGVLLTLAVAVKLSTVVLAPAGVILIALVDRRRAAMTVVAGLLAGTAWLALTSAMLAERQWLVDMVRLNRDTMFSSGFREIPIQRILDTLISKVLVSPVTAALPAAIVLVSARRDTRADSARVAALLVAVAILLILPAVLQVPSLVYHLASLTVLASALVAIGVARSWRSTGPPWPVLGPLLVYGLVAVTLLSQPLEWRDAAQGLSAAVAVSGAVATLVGAWIVVRRPRTGDLRPHGRGSVTVAGAGIVASVGLVLLLPTVLPGAGWAAKSLQSPYTNASWAADVRTRAADLDALGRSLGAEDAVLYLAYGTAAYHLGNPTPCRYPSPLFLQRSAIHSRPLELPSYRDNLDCLAADVEALVIEPRWLRTRRLENDVRLDLQRRFDCDAGRSAGAYVLCRPR
jgi:hypothetical protein